MTEQEWRLYMGGDMLGDTGNVETDLISEYEGELVSGSYYSGSSNLDDDPSMFTSDKMTKGQLWAADQYGRENYGINESDMILDKKKEAWARVSQKYGVSLLNGHPYYRGEAFVGDYDPRKVGYTYGSIGDAKNFYTGKFTNSNPYEGEELASALDSVYGKVVTPPNMGKGWKGLYDQYKTWDAEDDAWYEGMQEYRGIGEGMKEQAQAKMAASGMKAGTEQWDRNLNRIDDMRIDLQQEREQKREKIKGTSVYQALEDEYKNLYRDEEQRVKGETVTKYNQVLSKAGYMRPAFTIPNQIRKYDFDTGRVYYEDRIRPARWINPVYTQEPYQIYEETPTKTGKLTYGTGDGTQAPSFDEFYKQNFGDGNYQVDDQGDVFGQGVEEETEAEKRARVGASGVEL